MARGAREFVAPSQGKGEGKEGRERGKGKREGKEGRERGGIEGR
jgi:hypothetical protein